jgi:hypothetical protein
MELTPPAVASETELRVNGFAFTVRVAPGDVVKPPVTVAVMTEVPMPAPVASPVLDTVTFPFELAQLVTVLPCESAVLQPEVEPSEYWHVTII